jgi:hypothetical protein
MDKGFTMVGVAGELESEDMRLATLLLIRWKKCKLNLFIRLKKCGNI